MDIENDYDNRNNNYVGIILKYSTTNCTFDISLMETRQFLKLDIKLVFNSIGSLEACQIKQAEGEIILKTKTSDNYFAFINIGDISKYAKKLETDSNGEIIIQDNNFTKSLFQTISETNSTINILIGSKKFIENNKDYLIKIFKNLEED
jgi:hypothetical protein